MVIICSWLHQSRDGALQFQESGRAGRWNGVRQDELHFLPNTAI